MKKIVSFTLLLTLIITLLSCTDIISTHDTTNITTNQTTSNTSSTVEITKGDLEILTEYVNQFLLPIEIITDIVLIKSFEDISIEWHSFNNKVLNKEGTVFKPLLDTKVKIRGTFRYNQVKLNKEFEIIVKGYSDENLVNYVCEHDLYDKVVLDNKINLEKKIVETVEITYKSLNKEVLLDDGTVNLLIKDTVFQVEVTYSKKTFLKTKIIDYIVPQEIDFNKNFLRDSQFDEKYAVNMENNTENNTFSLKENESQGIYYSKIYNTADFKSLVGGFSMNTSKKFTAELFIKIKVEGKWSKYLTYGEFGLGLQNKGVSETDGIAKMDTDEVKASNSNQKSNAFMYKLIIRREELSINHALRLVTISLNIAGYTNTENIEFSEDVNYLVPKLNQNIVPIIGNSICSPTSITMLLKYKGFNFLEFDEYENRYIANLAKDYGHQIFGNWVYNCMTASSFGVNAYTKYLTSYNELKNHLTKVGPVAASVKGDLGLYTTNGHLVVVKGYYFANGKDYVRINDPNLKDVEHDYELEVFLRVWRNVIYVVE